MSDVGLSACGPAAEKEASLKTSIAQTFWHGTRTRTWTPISARVLLHRVLRIFPVCNPYDPLRLRLRIIDFQSNCESSLKSQGSSLAQASHPQLAILKSMNGNWMLRIFGCFLSLVLVCSYLLTYLRSARCSNIIGSPVFLVDAWELVVFQLPILYKCQSYCMVASVGRKVRKSKPSSAKPATIKGKKLSQRCGKLVDASNKPETKTFSSEGFDS